MKVLSLKARLFEVMLTGQPLVWVARGKATGDAFDENGEALPTDNRSPPLFEFHNYEDGHDECRMSWDMGRSCAKAEGRLVYPAVDWEVEWLNSTGKDLFSLRVEVLAIRPRPGQYTSLGDEDDIVFADVAHCDLAKDFEVHLSISRWTDSKYAGITQKRQG